MYNINVNKNFEFRANLIASMAYKTISWWTAAKKNLQSVTGYNFFSVSFYSI